MISFLLKMCILFLISASLCYADENFAKRPDVQAFINNMVKKHHFKKKTLVKLFSAVKIRPQVIKQINRPLEKEPWHLYQMLFVSEWRIQQGVVYWKKHAATLKRAETLFGVPASIIVATIGIETKYGQRIGDYRVIDALTNLAFNHLPRAAFFKKELQEFLLLTREQKMDPLKITGSYAGAIGQPQFMPSSYRNYAINFSKSGKTDLIHNEVDVIGSIANYYQKHGWRRNDPIAVQAVTIGDRYNYLRKKFKIKQPMALSELMRFGVIPKNKINNDNKLVKVITLKDNYSKEYWLGYHNFDVIKRYNSSDLYAMSVYQLSSYITELRKKEIKN